MNPHLVEAKRNVYREGITIKYITVSQGVYDSDTGTAVNTETETTVISYPKRFVANQYNFPNLIGKEAMEWLIVATDLLNKPNPKDKIKRDNTVYSVESVKEIIARGETVLYKVIAVKG